METKRGLKVTNKTHELSKIQKRTAHLNIYSYMWSVYTKEVKNFTRKSIFIMVRFAYIDYLL